MKKNKFSGLANRYFGLKRSTGPKGNQVLARNTGGYAGKRARDKSP